MFNNIFNEISWDDYISEFADFIDLSESGSKHTKTNKLKLKILQSQKSKKKKIFEDTDGEYVDFVEL